MDDKKWYIFTFGSGQQNAGHYVKIFGTYDSARREMVCRYGLQWGFQYSEDEWEDLHRRMPYCKFETELE